jgi:lipopolysaccharide/colanic/teichoic acid biosynthesis glycosyltransferase
MLYLAPLASRIFPSCGVLRQIFPDSAFDTNNPLNTEEAMTLYGGGTPRNTNNLEISSTAVLDRAFAGSSAYDRAPDHVDSLTVGLAWKRALDIVFSVVALVFLSPLMLAAALAVKLTSPGPVIFSQERIGINRRSGDRRRSRRYLGPERRSNDRRKAENYGKPFKMYKFRSMVADAEKGSPIWAKKNDSRITPVGALMRRTRIDELPQFVNVLKGEMSIVGPRPERAYFIAEIEKELPEFQQRLRTKPGITGLAQVEHGYANSVNEMHVKLDYDLQYIQDLKPQMELKILFKTVSVVFTGKGAY